MQTGWKKRKIENGKQIKLIDQCDSLSAASLFPPFINDLCCKVVSLEYNGWSLNICLSLKLLEEETYKLSNNDHNINYYLYIVL